MSRTADVLASASVIIAGAIAALSAAEDCAADRTCARGHPGEPAPEGPVGGSIRYPR